MIPRRSLDEMEEVGNSIADVSPSSLLLEIGNDPSVNTDYHQEHALNNYHMSRNYLDRKSSEFNTFRSSYDAQTNVNYTSHLDDRPQSYWSAFVGSITSFFSQFDSWLIVASVGILTALTAAYVEVSVEFLSDMKIGTCKHIPLISERYCCGANIGINIHSGGCNMGGMDVNTSHTSALPDWYSWAALAGFSKETAFYWWFNYAAYIAIGTAFAVSAAIIVSRHCTRAAGSGIPEVKTVLSGFVMRGLLGAACLFTKCFGLVLAVASGLSLGKEGPFVHIACCWANLMARLSSKYKRNEAKQRELLSAAAAAGVTVAFGAPIGGVLFSLEEVSSYFPPKTLFLSFFSAVITAIVYQYLDPRASGTLSLFQLDSTSLVESWELIELIPFTVLGILGGIFGAAFVHLNVQWVSAKRRSGWFVAHPVTEVAIIGFLSAMINFLFPMLRVLTSELLSILFERCGSSEYDPFSMCSSTEDPVAFSDYVIDSSILSSITVAMTVKFIFTVCTFGSSVPAGLFIPSLAIGACYGRLMGLLMLALNEAHGFIECEKCIHPGVYALIGAASMLGGVTRMTISLVVIMFELTGGLTYVVPFMLVILISKFVGDALCEYGIYDYHIILKGYPYLQNADESSYGYSAADVMERELVVVTKEKETVGSIMWKLQKYNFHGFPLVESLEDPVLSGYIAAQDLEEKLGAAIEIHGLEPFVPVYFTYPSRGVSGGFGDTREVSSFALGGVSLPEGPNSAITEAAEITLQRTYQQNVFDVIVAYSGASVLYVIAAPLVAAQPMQFISSTPMKQIHHIFRYMGIRICFFTHHGRLEGILTKKQLVRILGRNNLDAA